MGLTFRCKQLLKAETPIAILAYSNSYLRFPKQLAEFRVELLLLSGTPTAWSMKGMRYSGSSGSTQYVAILHAFHGISSYWREHPQRLQLAEVLFGLTCRDSVKASFRRCRPHTKPTSRYCNCHSQNAVRDLYRTFGKCLANRAFSFSQWILLALLLFRLCPCSPQLLEGSKSGIVSVVPFTSRSWLNNILQPYEPHPRPPGRFMPETAASHPDLH